MISQNTPKIIIFVLLTIPRRPLVLVDVDDNFAAKVKVFVVLAGIDWQYHR